MREERIDYLKSSIGAFFQRKIYIPETCKFTVTGSANGNSTTLTTAEPHCLSDNDLVQLSLEHEANCNVILPTEQWSVTRIDDTSFSIPYDSSDCVRALTGIGFKPLDLSAYTYTAEIYEDKRSNFSGNHSGAVVAGSHVVSVTGHPNTLGRLAVGNDFTLEGSISGRIIGVTAISYPFTAWPNQKIDREKAVCYVTVSNAASDSVNNGSWYSSTIESSKIGDKVVDGVVTQRDAFGELTFSFDTTGLDDCEGYHYRIFENIGALGSPRFFGRITWGDEAQDETLSIAAHVAAFPVIVADPDQISNVPVIVPNIATLRAIDVSGLPTGTPRLPAGYYALGDCEMPTYYYDQASAIADNGGTVIAPNAGAGRWIAMEPATGLDAKVFGVTYDGVPRQTELSNAIAALNTVLFSPDDDTQFIGIDSAVLLRSGVTLKGLGAVRMRIEALAGFSQGQMFTLPANTSNVQIEHLHIETNNQPRLGSAVLSVYAFSPFAGIDDFRLLDCELSQTGASQALKGPLVFLNSTNKNTRILIRRCYFHDFGQGINGRKAIDNIIIDDCEFRNYLQHAVLFTAENGSLINNVKILNSYWGFPLTGGDPKYPIEIQSAGTGWVENIKIDGNVIEGPKVPYDGQNAGINNATADQISLHAARYFSVTNNTSSGSGDVGITCSQTSRDGIIKGNICFDCDTAGIYIGNGANGVTVEGNICFDNTIDADNVHNPINLGGIVVTDADATASQGTGSADTRAILVIGNRCYNTIGPSGTQENGIVLETGVVGNLVEYGNLAYNNRTEQIRTF